IAAAEFLKVEVIVSRRSPEPERINGLATVTHDRSIERDANQAGGLAEHRAQFSAPHFERAVELYVHRIVRAGNLPRVGAPEPIVRQFVLPAILDGLLEDTVLIPQSITHGWNLHRGHRIKEAGRQTSKTSVAEAGIGFLLQHFEPVQISSLGSSFRNGIEE